MSHSAKRVPVAVLISGRGSNMTALIEAAHDPDYPAEIRLVISNIPDAPGLETARAAGIQTLTIDHRIFGKNREAHERAIDSALRDAGIEIVCLAGYMRLLTPFLTDAWSGRMLNIHPSLLPEFPGLHTHERAIAAKASKHGCTIHLVTAGMDEGPVLAQAAVDVFPDDTPESLAARVLKEEHQLYPKTLAELIRKNTD
ncbi:MAG: phosphoribosylglycinamide formyltransferase [Acetobacter sp.]|jgi:phosphoribosylglycinamide formyltransferase-1